jgi:probable rRNA maturation factor
MPSEPEDVPVLLGDIVICPAVAFRNAPEHAGNYDDEVALLVVHGLLHLMGMDHQEDDEAEEMEAKERELLSRHYAEIRAETWQATPGGREPALDAGQATPGTPGTPATEISSPPDAAAANDGDAPSNGGRPVDGPQPGKDSTGGNG